VIRRRGLEATIGRRSLRFALAVGLASGVLGVGSAALAVSVARPSASGHLAGTSDKGDVSAPIPCGLGAAPLGYIVVIAPQHSAEDLSVEGYQVFPVVAKVENETGVTPSADVEVSTNLTDGDPVDLSTLRLNPAVSVAGPVYPVSRNSALQSCDYQLSDAPAAQPYISAGEAAMEAGGFATASELTSGSLMLSDNPVDSSSEILTAVLGSGVSSGQSPVPAAGPANTESLTAVVAIIETSDFAVTQVGYGSWYEGTSPSPGQVIVATPTPPKGLT
jgi:hypothetical protein